MLARCLTQYVLGDGVGEIGSKSNIVPVAAQFIIYICLTAGECRYLMSQSHCSNSMHLGQGDLLKLKLSIRMGKKNDSSDSECSMVAGAKWVGLFHKLLICSDSSTQSSLGFPHNGPLQNIQWASVFWVKMSC